jgi:transglutaminase-like putative cysteine protease
VERERRHSCEVRFSRWIDHLPPWLAYGAVVSTGVYEPGELAFMIAPLLFAALAEWRRWGLGSWRRTFEILALACFLGLVGARIGLVPTIISMLFLLSGIRLSLPRDISQRRQLLLMGFLIWITTAISTFELSFLLWSLLWVAGAGLALMQQTWEGSASLRGGPLQKAPYRRLPGWTIGTVLLAAAFFAAMPRITLGLRSFPWGVAGLTATQAGLSDTLDLGDTGAVTPNSEVVLRVLPTEERSRSEESLALLKGITLEALEGQRWSPHPDTPRTPFASIDSVDGPFTRQMSLEYFVAPSPHGILPFPYGRLALLAPQGMPITQGPGGSLRWLYPSRRPIPLRFLLEPATTLAEAAPKGRRRALLTATGQGTESAERYCRRLIPGELPAVELANRLVESLRTFRYTLDNPSGNATNPLQNFLEISRAGHCEYFASALALMLRYRGIPARVVNGYRLGPWIAEGGYWLVTQNEAHSWVEFYDAGTSAWRVADPTPAAPATGLEAGTLWASLQRWTDAMRFRWDRHIVRFSDEDQLAGLEWIQSQFSGLPNRLPARAPWISALIIALTSLLVWGARRFRPHGRSKPSEAEHELKPLRPLLQATSSLLQPGSGETARQWLLRLSYLVPERADALTQVADEADAVAYGGGEPERLKTLVKTEAKTWRRSRHT